MSLEGGYNYTPAGGQRLKGGLGVSARQLSWEVFQDSGAAVTSGHSLGSWK